jgi:hypothetical protein
VAVDRFKFRPRRKCSCNLQIAQRGASHVAPFRAAEIDFDAIADIAAKGEISGNAARARQTRAGREKSLISIEAIVNAFAFL